MGKNTEKIIAMLLKKKLIAGSVAVLLGILPIAFVIALCVTSVTYVYKDQFTSLTIVDGDVYYNEKYEDLPESITTNGIETWTAEQRSFFDISKREKEYYNNGFSNYGRKNILKDSSEKYDITIPLSTTHYQGTVNVFAYDRDIEETEFSNKNYENNQIVNNIQTRDFFEQAGKRLGNTFMAYPGQRLLMGNLVKNNVTFYSVTYEIWPCDGGYCDNSSEIYSDWSYLGKISASNEHDAKQGYSPEKAVQMLSRALSGGQSICDKEDYEDKWLQKNACYETDLLSNETLGTDYSSVDSVSGYLTSKYDAIIKSDSQDFIVGADYLAVEVTKSIDHDTYEQYLRNVYIPYLYLDCEKCGYADESEEVRKNKIDAIYKDMRSFINSFKSINEEEIFFQMTGTTSDGNGGGGTHDVAYSCTEGSTPNIVSYYGHKGRDLNGVPVGTQVYPLFEGTVTSINNCNTNYSPEVHYDSSGTEYYTCQTANSNQCGYGNMIQIKGTAADGVEYYAIYGHLSRIDVSVGDKVDMNTVIGLLGNTGCSTGAHLHLELRKVSNYATYIYADSIYTREAVSSVLCSR